MKPLHPILVHFPLALLPLSAAADLGARFAGIPSLSIVGYWAILTAAGTAILTGATGYFDMRRATLSEPVHHRVHRHMYVGASLTLTLLVLAIWRWRMGDASLAVPGGFLIVELAAVALAAFQGWLGGELVYSDGVFVRESGKSDPNADSADQHSGHSH